MVAVDMAVIRIPYVNAYTDRHGNVRRYFRKRGHKPVPLPGAPGSLQFMAAYQTHSVRRRRGRRGRVRAALAR
jgi:hypothetical protein